MRWLFGSPNTSKQYAQPDAWQRTSSRSNDANEPASVGKTFLSCPTFFDRYSPLHAPFSIPLILYDPSARFAGWLVLMIVISPFLQFLMTLLGAHLALLRRLPAE